MLQPLHSPCYDHYDHDNDQPSLVMTKVPIFLEAKLLHEDVLYLLQTVQAVLDLQVNLRVLKMISNDFPYQRILGLKKTQVSSMLGSEVTPRSCS